MPSITPSVAHLYPERRAPKAEDPAVPGGFRNAPLAQPPVEQRPYPTLDIYVETADRHRSNPHLWAALSNNFVAARLAFRATPLRSHVNKSAGMWALAIGASLGHLYSVTGNIVVHEVLGHGVLGHAAVHTQPEGLPYWTTAVQSAAKANLTEVSADAYYWQSDWVDAMAMHGVFVGTAMQLSTIPGYPTPKPNDTAWSWNNLDDKTLQTVLTAFAANKTDYFSELGGFVAPESKANLQKTNFGRRLGTDGANIWVNLAGSVPGFATVSAAWLAVQHLESNRPLAALVATTFGNGLHAQNVWGMRYDVSAVAKTLSSHVVGQAFILMALMYGALALPFAIDAASRSRRGVNKELVSNEYALKSWLERAFRDPNKAAQLTTLLAAYPGRSAFHANTDVSSLAFKRQLMDCYAYLQTSLAGELATIKRTEAAKWRAYSHSTIDDFDTLKTVFRAGQALLTVTSAISARATPGDFFSGHVALALPGIAALSLAATLAEAAKNQAVREVNRDPSSLMQRTERFFDNAFG